MSPSSVGNVQGSGKLKVGEHQRIRRDTEPPMGEVAAMMATYERPGLLEKTVRSFMATAPGVPLVVFDDGSLSSEKREELYLVEGLGATVVRLSHAGFISTWLEAFRWARAHLVGSGGVVALEDDLSFAKGWLDVLRWMHDGVARLEKLPGAMTCLRVHDTAQSAIVNLGGVQAYQSMGHSWQVNLLPWPVVMDEALQEAAAACARKDRHGLDVHFIGLMSHLRGRTSFMATRSWVAHEGLGKSVVKGQGYRPLEHRGYELVEELRRD
jgi:hypothetical protein